MGSFGERLQREREMRSITLEEIADSTKISCRFLRALETEDFTKLPGGIFNKGFVRAYAKYLGIDEEQAVADFVSAESGPQKSEKLPVADPNQPSLFTPSSNGHKEHVGNIYAAAASRPESEDQGAPDHAATLMTAAIILVIVLGIGGLAWKFFADRSAAQATSPGPAPVIRQAEVQAPQTPTASTANPQTTQPTAEATPTSQVSPDPKKPDVTPPPVSTAPDKSQLALSTSPLETTSKKTDETKSPDSSASDKAVRLNLHMKNESWVSVKADGKLQWEGVLPASTFRSFKASKEIVVKLGNASGVEVSYNGKNMAPFPSDAKTRTFTISENGVVQQ